MILTFILAQCCLTGKHSLENNNLNQFIAWIFNFWFIQLVIFIFLFYLPKLSFIPELSLIISIEKNFKKLGVQWTYDSNTSPSETSFVDFFCLTGSNVRRSSRWGPIKKKFVSVFKQDDKHRDQPDVRLKSQFSLLDATTSATGAGTPALIFLLLLLLLL